MQKFALKITGLTKVYSSWLKALDNVDFSIPLGGFVALLGENWAGKSTLINILSWLIPKTEGKIEVFGRDIDDYREEAKLSIGLMPQEVNLSIFEKCIDIVTTVGGFYGVPLSIARPRAEKILTELGLWDKMESTARTLSGGMKRRLMLARALIHEPKLLILDEPTAGVDVWLRRGMWEYLQKLQRETGMTIMLTTHYLEEVEALCEHVTILDHGVVVTSDTVKNTLKKLERETYLIEVEGKVWSDFPGFVSLEDGNLTVIIDGSNPLASVFAKLADMWVTIWSVRPKENRLEAFFLSKRK
jgi:ABC-2 type transport system ATP-binding protein